MRIVWQKRIKEYTSCMKLIEYATLAELEAWYIIPLVWGQWTISGILSTNTSVSFRVYYGGNTTELHIFNK